MSSRIVACAAAGMFIGVASVFAQEAPAPSLVEVTYMPAGAAYFTSKGDAPSFGNYGFGTGVAFNLNRYFAIEGELGAMIATTSDLQFGDLSDNIKAPNALSYSANVVVTPWAWRAWVPYGTGGVGGLTMFQRAGVLPDDETFVTGNVGGGNKWFAPNARWGLRGDYRFGVTQSKESAPDFFGRHTRYVHRVYAGVVINAVR